MSKDEINPEERFADKIEDAREKHNYSGGSTFKRMVDGPNGDKQYGPYWYHVSPPSAGRNWTYLGITSGKPDLDGDTVDIDVDREDLLGGMSTIEDFAVDALGEDAFEKYNDVSVFGIGRGGKNATITLYPDDDKGRENDVVDYIEIRVDQDENLVQVKSKPDVSYDSEETFKIGFVLDDVDNIEEEVADAFREVHEKNKEAVREASDKLTSEYDMASDVAEHLVWGVGSKELIEDDSTEEVLESVDIPETTVSMVTGFETEHERRVAQDDTREEFEDLVDEVPNLRSQVRDRIIDEYVTDKSVSEASVNELTEIDGVGRTTAERLKFFAEKNLEDYEKQIPDDKTVSRAEKLKEEALERDLVSEITDKKGMSNDGLFKRGDLSISMNADALQRGGHASGLDGRESYEQVLAHEIAHTLEGSQTKGHGTVDAAEGLNDMSDEAQQELEYYHRILQNDDRRKPHERFVNYVAGLVAEPEKTKSATPTATEEFEDIFIEQAEGDRREVLEMIVNDEL